MSEPKPERNAAGDATHKWINVDGHDWQACADCGLVRRRDRMHRPCKGKVRVELRNADLALGIAEVLHCYRFTSEWFELGDNAKKHKHLDALEIVEALVAAGYTISEPGDTSGDTLTLSHSRGKEEEREACAKICEAEEQAFLSPEYATGQPMSSFEERFACRTCAAAIRARTTGKGD